MGPVVKIMPLLPLDPMLRPRLIPTTAMDMDTDMDTDLMDMATMARDKLRPLLLLDPTLMLMLIFMDTDMDTDTDPMDMLIMVREKLTLMLMPGGVTTDTPMVATMAMDTIPMDTTGEESNHKKNNFTTMIAPDLLDM